MNNRYDIIPTNLVVEAMRDNGYKNTAYAIAELMDNSIQAGATLVELICVEEELLLNQSVRKHLRQIAVLDNGCGMDADVLRIALQFGNGTRLETGKKSGIGRFGMGLPASSISQCTKVEVWTWQNGVESAIYSYLDVNQIRKGEMTEVPEPEPRPVPELWRRVGQGYSKTGTLVVWSNLDRCMWKTAGSVIRNSEFLIGRMYRRFLDRGEVRIRLVSCQVDGSGFLIGGSVAESFARSNDPGYLMENTSCPPPWDKEPMFKPWGDELIYKIRFRGENYEVRVRFSLAKEEARSHPNAGSLPHGRHAEKNTGISIVRADRELELDKGLVIGYDPRERWWGVEIEFPPSLDDLFGVTNNKQSARYLADVFKNLDSLQPKDKSFTQYLDEGSAEEDPQVPLIQLAARIRNNLDTIRKLIQAQTKGTRSAQERYDPNSPERIATVHTLERRQQGHQGVSDRDEELPPEQRKEIIEKDLKEHGVSESTARELAAQTVSEGLKYTFIYSDLEMPAFFSVRPKGGAIIITLNSNHPAYNNLVEVLEEDVEGASEDELRSRLENALKGLKLLLMSWARYEDEQLDDKRRQELQDIRNDWGRIARRFLSSNG